MKPGISVIIPTYNREKFVIQAIQSILNQEYEGNIEIIISDDGSNDNTLKNAENFGEKIKIFKKPENCKTQGVATTRNRGIKVSTQPFICFLDSDDFYLPGHFKNITPLFENIPRLGFAFCRVLEVKKENDKELFREWTHRRIFKDDIKNPVVSRSRIVHTNSFMFRKEVFEKVGYFNESYSNAEDSDLWMRISEQYEGAFSNHYGATYRSQHSTNQLTNNSIEKINACHSEVHMNALSRYYELGLNDLDRIFELKHLILNCRYRNKKIIYFFKYLGLISRYPLSFSIRILKFYYELFEKNKIKDWYGLQKFIEHT